MAIGISLEFVIGLLITMNIVIVVLNAVIVTFGSRLLEKMNDLEDATEKMDATLAANTRVITYIEQKRS